MPYINVKTSAKIDKKHKRNIMSRISDVIGLIPGKSASYLMVSVDDEADMMFHRDADLNLAMVEVKIFGKADKRAYGELTAAICNIMQDEADVPGDCCYVKYEEVAYWGYNGFMF